MSCRSGTNWAGKHLGDMAKGVRQWPERIHKEAMQAYDSGAKAALHGWSEESNPYRPGTYDYSDWLAGFEDFAEEDDFLDATSA